jgi:hypothetical protein
MVMGYAGVIGCDRKRSGLSNAPIDRRYANHGIESKGESP